MNKLKNFEAFPKERINERVDEILKKNELRPLYTMSTSGSFSVTQCINDESKKNYILKVRRFDSNQVRKEFVNEVYINKFLGEEFSEEFPYKIISYDVDRAPEYFLYEMIEGWALNGYYFLVGSRQKDNYHPREVIYLLKTIQSQTIKFQEENPKVELLKRGFDENMEYFYMHENFYSKNFSKKYYDQAKNILEAENKHFNESLVLCHGDLNPKNILKKKNGQTAFIDWTDVSINNPLYDVVRLYMSSWNAKDLQTELKLQALKNLHSNEKLFNLNILISTGKYLRVLENSSLGVRTEYTNGILNFETRNKMLGKVEQAHEKATERFKKSLDYLS